MDVPTWLNDAQWGGALQFAADRLVMVLLHFQTRSNIACIFRVTRTTPLLLLTFSYALTNVVTCG
jgi:hypothetical protein